MTIDYQDKDKKNIDISIDAKNTAVLNIAAFSLGDVRVAASKFDLTDYQGDVFRLYAEENGDLSANKWACHYWMLIEEVIPEMQMTFDNDEMVEIPLDLNNVKFKLYSLPEGENK